VVLTLIGAHAILHQARREQDAQGRVVATIEDYEAVYDLVIDLISEGVQASVSDTIRQTVQAVEELSHEGESVKVSDVAKRLGLDHSAAWRRVRVAIRKGYLVNLEDRPRRPARLALGDPLPEEEPVLPSPETLRSAWQECVCHTPPESVQTCKHIDWGEITLDLPPGTRLALPRGRWQRLDDGTIRATFTRQELDMALALAEETDGRACATPSS